MELVFDVDLLVLVFISKLNINSDFPQLVISLILKIESNVFTSKGPLTIEKVLFSPGDTVITPGVNYNAKFYFRNQSETATANNLQIGISSTDECLNVIILKSSIESIAPSEVGTAVDGFLSFSTDGDCNKSEAVIILEISEGDYSFWTDTLTLPIAEITSSYQLNDQYDKWSLQQNYPNPFHTNTSIRYYIPSATDYKIIIYNLMGQEVVRFVDAATLPGFYEKVWDGSNSNGSLVPNGTYLYKLQADEFIETKRMILLR